MKIYDIDKGDTYVVKMLDDAVNGKDVEVVCSSVVTAAPPEPDLLLSVNLAVRK